MILSVIMPLNWGNSFKCTRKFNDSCSKVSLPKKSSCPTVTYESAVCLSKTDGDKTPFVIIATGKIATPDNSHMICLPSIIFQRPVRYPVWCFLAQCIQQLQKNLPLTN